MATRKPKAPTGPTPVESVRHEDRRVNLPTGELSHLVDADEAAPKPMLYPRDPSLDPQLVWRGKDAQDLAALAVPSVPVYIQEKIVPQAIIENLRATAERPEDEPELRLFDDFDGLSGLELLESYQHEANWSNRMILGDSLLVMTSLAEKEALRGKVQTIYVDPPYGIKFGSNWQVSTRKREVSDGKVADATRQPEQIKAFRDTWELGIHSYLAYLRDRLTVARELLTETGSIFVQIGDENVHLVRSLLDEVFGAENFVSLITFNKTAGTTGRYLSGTVDYMLWYARDIDSMKYRPLFIEKVVGGAGGGQYTWIEEPNGVRRRATASDANDSLRILRMDNLTSSRVRAARTGYYSVEFDGRPFLPGKGEWKTNQEGMRRLALAGRLHPVGNTLSYVRYLDDFGVFPLSNQWTDTVTSGFADPKMYVVQTNTKVIERCLLMTTDPGDLVIDPTCGAGTTAFVAEQWGRRWITCDTSRVALALARTRVMSARYPAYLLADSAEGAAKEAQITAQVAAGGPFEHNVRKGFVYRRVPHVTLKSIAQNPDIHEGMSRAEIDTAIARHAETELLVDQPYVDSKRVRVAGRFTVESLSPHRMLDRPDRDVEEVTDPEAVQFETMILDNLRKAGVQNTFKGERLQFERLEPYAGQYLQAEGDFTDADGTTRRVAVSIGPEFGTVSPDQIRDAAIEASKGVPFDLLVVTGFAFDPHAWETAKEFGPDTAGRRLGKLTVVMARANPDLSMGDELLKKTGAGNLFTIFGEPDLEISTTDGMVTVELRGLDVYDPTTGEVRAASVDTDVACWFVDTDYDGKSFFVRHAYFAGAQEHYNSLRRALRAEIDEAAWHSLYSSRSRPFPTPTTGRIAIKVINHYGDEVLHTYDIAST